MNGHSTPQLIPEYRPRNAELDPAEWRFVVGPVSNDVSAPLGDWIDSELETLEERFSQFCTPQSYTSSLGRAS